MENLFSWILNLTNVTAQFFTWLTSNLPYTNFSPLSLFSLGGLTFLIGFHALRLFVGG